MPLVKKVTIGCVCVCVPHAVGEEGDHWVCVCGSRAGVPLVKKVTIPPKPELPAVS